MNKTDRKRRIEALIEAFGLQEQSKSLIGTPIRKGISGGQKRRVSVASQLITSPKVLFLDEVCVIKHVLSVPEVLTDIKSQQVA